MTTLDELRAAHPALGFALYAYEPGGPVTLEVLAPATNETFTFTGRTAGGVLDLVAQQLLPAPAVDEPETSDVFEDDTPDVFE